MELLVGLELILTRLKTVDIQGFLRALTVRLTIGIFSDEAFKERN